MAINRYYSSIAQDTTLTSGITSGATSMTVSATTGWPLTTYPFTLALDYNTSLEELVDVTAVTGTTITITRGVDSTTPVAHGVGAIVRHVITARDMRETQAHIASTTGAHGVTGAIVGNSDAQTLTNKTIDYTLNTITNLPATPTGAALSDIFTLMGA